jgi:A/G-specific adenine glycosylase
VALAGLRDSAIYDVRRAVIGWAETSLRRFPWRDTSDPYKVLVAEILLQRTPAYRVAPVYQALVARYPDSATLASADPAEVKQLIAPLGLLNRAARLVAIGHEIVTRFGGRVPNTLSQLQSLPGVGRYVAGAVLCFAFGRPEPLLDNVSGRVFRRFLGVVSRGNRRDASEVERFVSMLTPQQDARLFNLAIVDIGGLFCRPRRALCSGCPLASMCAFARVKG